MKLMTIIREAVLTGMTGLHGCKDVLQVSDLLDCESASTPQSSSNELGGTAPLAPEQVPL